jgi:hypothetical protein
MRLFFIRVQSFGGMLENLMCVDVKLAEGVELTTKEAYEAIEDACTKWANETTEGRNAWEDSSEDFNIGDLACGMCPSLRTYLLEKGIEDIEFEQADRDQLNYYDQVLIGRVKEVGHE